MRPGLCEMRGFEDDVVLSLSSSVRTGRNKVLCHFWRTMSAAQLPPGGYSSILLSHLSFCPASLSVLRPPCWGLGSVLGDTAAWLGLFLSCTWAWTTPGSLQQQEHGVCQRFIPSADLGELFLGFVLVFVFVVVVCFGFVLVLVYKTY